LRFISEGTLGILSGERGDGSLGTAESFCTETIASLDLNYSSVFDSSFIRLSVAI